MNKKDLINSVAVQYEYETASFNQLEGKVFINNMAKKAERIKKIIFINLFITLFCYILILIFASNAPLKECTQFDKSIDEGVYSCAEIKFLIPLVEEYTQTKGNERINGSEKYYCLFSDNGVNFGIVKLSKKELNNEKISDIIKCSENAELSAEPATVFGNTEHIPFEVRSKLKATEFGKYISVNTGDMYIEADLERKSDPGTAFSVVMMLNVINVWILIIFIIVYFSKYRKYKKLKRSINDENTDIYS